MAGRGRSPGANDGRAGGTGAAEGLPRPAFIITKRGGGRTTLSQANRYTYSHADLLSHAGLPAAVSSGGECRMRCFRHGQGTGLQPYAVNGFRKADGGAGEGGQPFCRKGFPSSPRLILLHRVLRAAWRPVQARAGAGCRFRGGRRTGRRRGGLGCLAGLRGFPRNGGVRLRRWRRSPRYRGRGRGGGG